MSCSPFDLRDYMLDELAEPERQLVEQHARSCTSCREELQRLGATRAALLTLPDEEIPQRIGFVSDAVFEVSLLRRWFRAFWGSAARLGFASAGMVSAALVFSAVHTRPAPAPVPAPVVDMARVEASFEQRTAEAVKKAVADAETRQERRTAQLLSAADQRHQLELRNIQLAVEQELTVLQKRFNQVRLTLASNEFGQAR